jgi:1,4-alpha-glucan branching enzyme
MPLGHLSILLHAHLPWVRHPEHERFFEESWLFEAITESYLPLLRMLESLEQDGVAYRLALSLSPTLLEMLDDPLLRGRFARHLDDLIRLAERERERTRLLPAFRALALRTLASLHAARERYHDRYRGDLVAAFRAIAERGRLELLTCAATHAYLPLMLGRRSSWRAQMRVAVEAFRRRFGKGPSGFWLPECAYEPGVEEVLAEQGIEWFVVDTHGILLARPRPRLGPYAPVLTPRGVAAFGRDPESSRQVWSAVEGYPGDPSYRDFHRDIGYELPAEYLGLESPFGEVRVPTGIKYHRVTGRTEEKEPYEPARALATAARHASDFVESRRAQMRWLADRLQRPPVIVAPYDAELFGHWWYEGPVWLEHVLRKCARENDVVLATPSDVLGPPQGRNRRFQVAAPATSSWGRQGYHGLWLDRSNHWIYPPLHEASERMEALALTFPRARRQSALRRALDQAAREVLLAQASDWPFIIEAGTLRDYAERRVRGHLDAFFEIERAVRQGRLSDPAFRARLSALQDRDRLFAEIDYRVFRPDAAERAPTERDRPGARQSSVAHSGGNDDERSYRRNGRRRVALPGEGAGSDDDEDPEGHQGEDGAAAPGARLARSRRQDSDPVGGAVREDLAQARGVSR